MARTIEIDKYHSKFHIDISTSTKGSVSSLFKNESDGGEQKGRERDEEDIDHQKVGGSS
jgi:hypothetical protein